MDTEKKRMIEGALFVSSRSMSLEELMRLIGVAAPGFVKNILEELKNDYIQMGSAVEIVETDGKWIMRLKSEYSEGVRSFAQQAEVSKHALRTLAYLSKHDGAFKSHLAKKIGSQIYDDVRELAENGFIRQVKAGRTKRLFLTDKFRQYFREVKTEGQSKLE
ncbi:SMC-Scp complex subunit ScpB [Candidatus Micrarchaeota archaeon]|nr:SMC-Scp complex subunit ScpB [Candidatus Micrarchaeota archaeon]